MKVKNIFSCFLIFVLSFNFIIIGTEEVSATAEEVTKGPRDRVRKFYEGEDSCELDFKYNKASPEDPAVGGFSCKPGKLKFYESSQLLKSGGDILDILGNIAAVGFSILMEL
ncbi:MAG: hypothetical protein LBP39_00945, partial [Rickettsiales bacterium]|nr:hypothetical protein [Rickettsiales bacterium]